MNYTLQMSFSFGDVRAVASGIHRSFAFNCQSQQPPVSDVHEGQTVVGRIDTRFDLNRDLRHCAIRFCGREDSRSN